MRAVDEFSRHSPAGETAGVGPVGVVVGEVVDEVALEGVSLGTRERANEGAPALLEHGQLETLDVLVGGGGGRRG